MVQRIQRLLLRHRAPAVPDDALQPRASSSSTRPPASRACAAAPRPQPGAAPPATISNHDQSQHTLWLHSNRQIAARRGSRDSRRWCPAWSIVALVDRGRDLLGAGARGAERGRSAAAARRRARDRGGPRSRRRCRGRARRREPRGVWVTSVTAEVSFGTEQRAGGSRSSSTVPPARRSRGGRVAGERRAVTEPVASKDDDASRR